MQGYANSKLAYETNLDADTYYYPSSAGLAMEGHVAATIGLVLAGGATATIEATMGRGLAKDGVAPAWVDISKSALDLEDGADAVASWVDENVICQLNGLCVEAIRVKVVTSDTTNTVGVWLRRM